MLSAFIVVLLIGASYRGDPSADGPAKRSAPQTISFAPSAGPGDINKRKVRLRWSGANYAHL